jgi:hypothetical protein
MQNYWEDQLLKNEAEDDEIDNRQDDQGSSMMTPVNVATRFTDYYDLHIQMRISKNRGWIVATEQPVTPYGRQSVIGCGDIVIFNNQPEYRWSVTGVWRTDLNRNYLIYVIYNPKEELEEYLEVRREWTTEGGEN